MCTLETRTHMTNLTRFGPFSFLQCSLIFNLLGFCLRFFAFFVNELLMVIEKSESDDSTLKLFGSNDDRYLKYQCKACTCDTLY